MRRTAAVWLLALVASLSACASPFAEPVTETDQSGLPQDLGKSATSAKGSSENGSRKDAGSDKGGPKGSDGSAKSTKSTESSDDGGDSIPAGGEDLTMLGSLTDPDGDIGGTAPDYADITGVAIGDLGGRARVIVEVAGTLPAQTEGAEVVGLGVDLYRDSGDYQLFASGEPGGWFGYLYAEDGFVAYRGDIEVGNSTVIFTVPWDAIGGRGSGEFGVFLDWTASGGRNSQDLAPESGRSSFEGAP